MKVPIKIVKAVGVLGVIIYVCFYNPVLFAQAPDTTWTRTYGGTGLDQGWYVQQTTDHGYIVTGIGGTDVYLIKTDENGDTLWTKKYGGPGTQYGYSAQQTTDHGYIIVGSTKLPGGFDDVYLIKTDENGDTLWTKTYGGGEYGSEIGKSVQQTSDGYIILGYTTSFGAGQADIWLLKTDSFGDTLWTKTYGGEGYDYGQCVQQIPDGYIVAGRSDSDGYLIKTDENGDSLWTRTYSNANFYSVQQINDQEYIVTGIGGGDVCLIKFDENGDTLWTKTYGGTGSDCGYSVKQTNNGYIIVGRTNSFGAGNHDIYLIETDENGDTLWTKTYGGLSADYGLCVQQTIDRGYIVVGYMVMSGLGDQVWLMKTEAPNVAPISIDIPQQVPEDTTLYPMATIKNFGKLPATFLVTCEIEPGSYSKNRTVSGLAPGDSVQITFFQQFTFDGGTYEVKVYSRLNGDKFPENDTLVKDIETYPPGITENNVNPITFSFGLNNNPAKNTALFNLALPEDALIALKIYDISGRLIDKIAEHKSAGYYQIPWCAKVAGVYLYKLESPWKNVVGKLVVFKNEEL